MNAVAGYFFFGGLLAYAMGTIASLITGRSGRLARVLGCGFALAGALLETVSSWVALFAAIDAHWEIPAGVPFLIYSFLYINRIEIWCHICQHALTSSFFLPQPVSPHAKRQVLVAGGNKEEIEQLWWKWNRALSCLITCRTLPLSNKDTAKWNVSIVSYFL